MAVADSSQHVTSATLTGTEAYDTSYSSAAAYTGAASAYSYSTPLQSQWAAYSAAHPVRFYFDSAVSRLVSTKMIESESKSWSKA